MKTQRKKELISVQMYLASVVSTTQQGIQGLLSEWNKHLLCRRLFWSCLLAYDREGFFMSLTLGSVYSRNLAARLSNEISLVRN